MKSKPGNLVLEDIARLSGFSRSTVSRVINDHPYVNEDTRKKIMRVIEQYEFEPNPAARALASQKSNIIGVLIPHMVEDLFNDPFLALLMQSIVSASNRMDYNVNLWLESSFVSQEELSQRIVRHRLIDGWIIASAQVYLPLLNSLTRRHKPYVLIGRLATDTQISSWVDVENKKGAKLMVNHLISRGYRRIGMIRGRQNLPSSRQRFDGYLEAMQEAGYPIRPNWVTSPHDYTEITGYLGMRQLLEQGVDAVFAANDVIAAGAIHAIHEANLKIPDDIAIGGFDDLPLAKSISPMLTTIRQPINQLGKVAVEKLISYIEDQHTAFHEQVFPVELIIREST